MILLFLTKKLIPIRITKNNYIQILEPDLYELREINDNTNILNYKVLTSKKAEKKILDFIKYFKNQELPVFPIKAEDLMKKFNLTEGKKIGEYLKLLEDFWIKNNFSITEKDLERIVKN